VRRLVVPLVLTLVACESGSARSERTASNQGPPKPVADAKTPDADPAKLPAADAYAALCSHCHAKDLRGGAADHAPSLVNPTFLESAPDDFLRRSIAQGRPGTSMPAYGKPLGGPLDDPAIDGLVAYIRAQGPAAKALQPASKGDGLAGEKLYTEYCRTCHGDQKMRGEAVHLANLAFQQMASDAFIRHAIQNGRPGTKMQAFGVVMTAVQIDDVVAYVRELGNVAGANVHPLPPPTGKEPLVLNPRGRDPVWKPRADPCPKPPDGCVETPRYVSVDDVHNALGEQRKLVIIDARPQSDWMRVHVAGAVSIPYFEMKRLDEIPQDVWVVAYCACPHHLSGIVVDELVKRGHAKALVLDEGINVWHQRGYPVVAAEGVKPPPKEMPVPLKPGR
jgi:mono/diheme cytochrome c family protein/rhodanese-related sulfurtransferase